MRHSHLIPVLILVAASGCKPPPTPISSNEQEAPVAMSPEAEARQIFAGRCSTCHGVNGTGDGPAGAALNPRPRNYHDAAWQASVTDAYIEQVIVQGGAAVGKSANMRPNLDLANKPAVVAALRAIVRSFR